MMAELQSKKYLIVENFLTPNEVVLLSDEMTRLREENRFAKAGVGKNENHSKHQEFRTDETLWFEPNELTETQKILWNKLESLKQKVNQELMLGLWELEGHYAIYGAGGFYKKHVDSFKNDDARFLSTVIYLNSDWKENDGGELRIYDNDEQVLVKPIGGTMVCFLSREVMHEVIPSKKERKSFAGWFKLRPKVL